MTLRIAIFLIMCGMLSYGWTWPHLLDLDGSLELWLRGSWLASIFAPAALLAWFVLRRGDVALAVGAWLAVSIMIMPVHPLFRAAELAGQVGLMALWLAAAAIDRRWRDKAIDAVAASVHLWMGAWGAVAKVFDPGWMRDAPEVMLRVYGPWSALVYAVPALAVIALSSLIGRTSR